MPKIAFIFPGQGSQYVGMGKDFYDNFKLAKNIFDQANKVLGFDLKKLCFEGPKEELKETVNCQPAVFTTSIACFEVLKEHSILPQVVAGHSLGEYSALVAAEAINFKDAAKLVRKRSEFMQVAAEKSAGGMAAIIGLNRQKVEQICQKASKFGIVSSANFNCPGQIVISGEKKALEKACELAKTAGAKKIIPLEVSGAFHTQLMAEASKALASELKHTKMDLAKIPVVANFSANWVTESEEIKTALIKQMSNRVLWEDSIQKMLNDGIDTFIEVGPGKVLSGLVKRISNNCQIIHVEDRQSLESPLKFLRVPKVRS